MTIMTMITTMVGGLSADAEATRIFGRKPRVGKDHFYIDYG